MASTEDFGLSHLSRAYSLAREENAQENKYSTHLQPEGYEQEHASLPRVDGGKAAWLFLAGCFSIEALVWGKSVLCIYSLDFDTLQRA